MNAIRKAVRSGKLQSIVIVVAPCSSHLPASNNGVKAWRNNVVTSRKLQTAWSKLRGPGNCLPRELRLDNTVIARKLPALTPPRQSAAGSLRTGQYSQSRALLNNAAGARGNATVASRKSQNSMVKASSGKAGKSRSLLLRPNTDKAR